MGKLDPYGGLKIQFHAELICKEKSFENTLLKYFFVEDKLVRITLERVMMKDRNLMDVFYKHYKRKIPDQVNKLEWRGSLEAESQDSLAFYIVANLFSSEQNYQLSNFYLKISLFLRTVDTNLTIENKRKKDFGTPKTFEILKNLNNKIAPV